MKERGAFRSSSRTLPIVIALAAVACTIGGLTSGEDIQAVPTQQVDAAIADTSVAIDSGTPDDTGPVSDAPVSDAPAPNFCAAHSTAALCEDFEGGSLGKLSTLEVAPATSTATVIAGTKSKFVLRSFTDVSTMGAFTRADAALPGTTSKFRYSCDVSVLQFEDAVLNEFCAAWLVIPTVGYHVITAGRATGGGLILRDGFFPEGAAMRSINMGTGVNVTKNTWMHLVITVDLASAAPTIQMKVDGGAATIINVAATDIGSGTLTIKAGLNYVGNPTVPVELLVDNVFVDLL